jgi:hypothetical protein
MQMRASFAQRSGVLLVLMLSLGSWGRVGGAPLEALTFGTSGAVVTPGSSASTLGAEMRSGIFTAFAKENQEQGGINVSRTHADTQGGGAIDARRRAASPPTCQAAPFRSLLSSLLVSPLRVGW